MSGIAAVVSLDGSGLPRSDIERMANVLRRYGPDGTNILTQRNAAFVFCLHKLTPEDSFERQPILFADRFVLLFDGRIDNRSELADMLAIRTGDLRSIPDSMVALRLFDRWGEQAFERILGVFAIIIMDLQAGQLVCARDHMGLRVLHYHRSTKHFAVATAPEPLFALSWVPRVLNKDKLADTLVNRGPNGETTYYQEISRVLPGSIVRVRGARLSKGQYWKPENIADVRFKNDQDYVDALQDRLDNAVKVSLRSCRVPCAFITGGLDSSSIAVVAADMLAANGQKLSTFTAVPERGFSREDLRGIYFDETPYVRQIAEANSNLISHFVPPSKEPILDQIAEQIRMGGGPWGILNGLWVMQIYGLARSAGHNVLLCGEMGNITMSYHGRGLFAELLRTGRWLRLFREINASGHLRRRMVRVCTISPFVPAPVYRAYKQWRRGGKTPWYHHSPIHPDFAAGSDIVGRAAREHMPFDVPPRINKLARAEEFSGYCETADWFATLRANFGIDTRAPAVDRRLVEFCIGVPEDQYLRNGCDRWLIRRAMKGRLPDSVLYKKKYGAQAADWFPRLTRERNQIAEEFRRLAANGEIASMLDLQRLTEVLENWPKSQPPDYSPEQSQLLTIPLALGAAYFVESEGANQIMHDNFRTVTTGD